jgi:hypothetical protein
MFLWFTPPPIKCTFLWLTPPLTLWFIISLKQRLIDDYGFDLTVKYEDMDGDFITIASQNDLNELIEGEWAESVSAKE